jgi:hypothetical protein
MDMTDARQLIWSAASESERIELRRKWLDRPDGVEVSKIKERKVNAISTGYLEGKVESELSALQEKRRQAAKEAAENEKRKVFAANDALRTALSADFIRLAGIRVSDGAATFMFKDKPYTLINDKERGYLLNEEKLADAPGTLGDKIVATLVRSEEL